MGWADSISALPLSGNTNLARGPCPYSVLSLHPLPRGPAPAQQGIGPAVVSSVRKALSGSSHSC